VFLVNGRCLGRPVTGVERYTREVSHRLSDRVQIVQPRGGANGLAGHLWEQVALPRRVGRDDLLWSPANTGPVATRRQVVTIHDLSPIDHPEWFHPAFASWYGYLLPRLAQRVCGIITDSSFSRTRILEQLNVPESRVTAIACGVSDTFSQRADEVVWGAERLFGLDKPYVLTVGSVQPRKNLGTLLRAWERLPSLTDEIDLVVAGATRRNFARPRFDPLPRGVRWLGYVEDDLLPCLYSGARCVVIPSLYEGFGLTVLEAMACGAAVIAATGSAMDEVVGDAGVLVHPQDADEMAGAIRQLLTDSQVQSNLRARGREQAQRYPWEQTACLTWKVLQDAADD
jgi:glycosyltransferase involved in cell wall biosynthesis